MPRPIYARAEKCLQSLAGRQICAVCGFCARRVNLRLKQKTAVKRFNFRFEPVKSLTSSPETVYNGRVRKIYTAQAFVAANAEKSCFSI